MRKHHRSVTAFAVIVGAVFSLLALSPLAGYTASTKSRDPLGLWSPRVARNVIIMISDGCGYNHVDATSLWETGRLGAQIYERFPVRCAVSTYSASGAGYDPARAWSEFAYVESGYTDSAAAATAMSTGEKTKNGMVGVAPDGRVLEHALEFAEALGKATGVVTTVPISHATPAGFVAHSPSRNSYEDIARYMIRESAVDVLLGCGHPWYDNDGQPTSPARYQYVGGKDTWEGLLDGTLGGDANADGVPDPWVLVETRGEFESLTWGPTPRRIIGIPQVFETLQQRRGGDRHTAPYGVPMNEDVPTLAEMTAAALNVLDGDPDGFFLMVEGGAVDWAGHANEPGRLIEEQIDFGLAVATVVEWVEARTSWWETLVIVTADHETGYLLGPGSDPDWEPLMSTGVGSLPGMEWHSTSHTNSLVPLFAKGAGSWLLRCLADEYDPVRGRYVDNTEVGETLFLVMAPRGWSRVPPGLWRRPRGRMLHGSRLRQWPSTGTRRDHRTPRPLSMQPD